MIYIQHHNLQNFEIWESGEKVHKLNFKPSGADEPCWRKSSKRFLEHLPLDDGVEVMFNENLTTVGKLRINVGGCLDEFLEGKFTLNEMFFVSLTATFFVVSIVSLIF